MSNRRVKRDANHGEVDAALRGDGWMTRDTSMLGDSWPDIIASKPGINLLVEVKAPGGELSEGQEAFHRIWPGPKIVAFSGADAVEKAHMFVPPRSGWGR